MVDRYYLDTSIWIDVFDDRVGYRGERFGEYASKLLLKMIKSNNRIVISDVLIRELNVNFSNEQIRGILNPYHLIIDKVFTNEIQAKEAGETARIRNIPFADVLHAIIARDHSLILISRDNHFKLLEDISEHYKPEDLI